MVRQFRDAMAADELIAAEGIGAARAVAGAPVRALTAMVGAYVEFARRQPAYFRLIFRPELWEPDKYPETKAALHTAAGLLKGTVDDCVAGSSALSDLYKTVGGASATVAP